MLRSKAGRLHSLIVVLDHLVSGAACVAVLSLPGMAALGHDPTPARILLVALFATVLWPALFEHLGLYQSQRRASVLHLAGQLLLAAAVSVAGISLVANLVAAPVAPMFPVLCGVAQLAALGLVRIGILTVLHLARRSGRNYRNVLIVGSGPRARQARSVIENHPEWGLRLLGLVDDRDTPVDPALSDVPVYKLSSVQDLFRDEVVDEVVVACPRSLLASLEPVVRVCAAVGVPVTLFSDIFGDVLPAPRAGQFGGMPSLSFAMVHHSKLLLAVKRGLDFVVASALLAVSLPILGIAAAAIKATSPGPVLFRQLRCGLNGRRFLMLKLRTMYADAEERKEELMHLNEVSGPVFKIRNDPRITPVGRFLRRYSIDELPQLWNVIRGDMSLVGPRPPVPAEVARYETFERRRLSMRPGLTCLWQVNGRSEIEFDEWVRLDLQYIDDWSISQDLKILAQTVPAVLRGTGAS